MRWILAVAHVAQLAERVLGKDEVISSTLIMGSIQSKSSKAELAATSIAKKLLADRRVEE
jgi:hypothetical protein